MLVEISDGNIRALPRKEDGNGASDTGIAAVISATFLSSLRDPR
jgi:hypothetical protein